jgi:hypothetical protein
MAAVGDIAEHTDRPAYVRFKRVAVEDKAASLEQRKYVAKDVDYALITPPYSKDCVEVKVPQWKVNMEADVRNERMPKEWADKYIAAYEAWKNGQELPLDGTPIRGWGVISPAQQEMLIRINMLTVEDLSGANDEGMKRIGMGSMDLRNKARAWLSQMNDKGPATIEIAALKAQNDSQAQAIEALTKQVEALKTLMPSIQAVPDPIHSESITADDILPEAETVSRKRR